MHGPTKYYEPYTHTCFDWKLESLESDLSQGLYSITVHGSYKEASGKYVYLFRADGGIEIKCPKLATHVKYILSDASPITYKCQIQGQIYICDLEWVDFVSYFPDADLFIKRVYRDDAFINKLDKAIDEFNEQLNEMVEKLRNGGNK